MVFVFKISCLFKPKLLEVLNIRASKISFVTLCVSFSVLISACNSQSIYHDHRFNPPVFFGTHIVRDGETMYGIARRYGRDFKELATANGITAPYQILPGQRINLEASAETVKSASRQLKSERNVNNNVTKRKDSRDLRNDVTKLKKSSDIKNIKWAWPHFGPILAKFYLGKSSSSPRKINKGIDLAGKLGDPVKAAANGEVVYAGSGLRGYGNLVIINHNERYLSAYAHNDKLLVQEGQKITQGQTIAEMGRSGADRIKLHFEIRRDGQPVDPLKYLPSR